VKHEDLEPGNVLEFWGGPWTPQNVWNLETSGPFDAAFSSFIHSSHSVRGEAILFRAQETFGTRALPIPDAGDARDVRVGPVS